MPSIALIPSLFVALSHLWFSVDINPAAVEAWANDILGPESMSEYKNVLMYHGGVRTNRVFYALGIEAPLRVASLRHRTAKEKKKSKKMMMAVTAPSTKRIESKEQKLISGASGTSKRSRAKDILFGAISLLKAAGDSEDDGEVDCSPLTVPDPPAACF